MTTFVTDLTITPGGGGTSISGSFNAGAGNYVRIWVFGTNGVSVTSISYGAQTPTLISSSANNDILGVYQLLSPASGSQTVTINLSGDSPRIAAYIVSRSGVNTSTPSGTPAHNTGESNAANVLASSASGQLVEGMCWMASAGDGLSSGGTGQTERENVTNWVDSSISHSAVEKAGASSVQLDWTTTNVDNPIWFATAIPVLPAAGGGNATITADHGTYVITGNNNANVFARKVTADQGSYAITGRDATLIKSGTNVTLTAEMGSYTITGSEGLADRDLAAFQGSFALTGFDATLKVGRVALADQGVHTIVGYDAGLIYSGAGPKIVIAENGTLTLAGQDAGLRRAARLVAESTVYNLTGFSVVGGVALDEDTIAFLFRVRKVLIVPTTGRVKWVNYIPIQAVTVTPQNIGTFNQLGAVEVELIGSGTGLVEWVDYIPVVETADPASGRWRYDNAGWIPVVYVD